MAQLLWSNISTGALLNFTRSSDKNLFLWSIETRMDCVWLQACKVKSNGPAKSTSKSKQYNVLTVRKQQEKVPGPNQSAFVHSHVQKHTRAGGGANG